MKLRLDLLEQVTAEDLLEEVLANNHRYKAEPLFSKTGTGSLSSAPMKELAEEEARNTALIRKLTEMSQHAGFSKNSPFNSTLDHFKIRNGPEYCPS